MADGGFLGLIGNFVSGAAGKAWSPQTGFAAAAASPPPAAPAAQAFPVQPMAFQPGPSVGGTTMGAPPPAFGGGANVPPPISQTRSAYD